MAEPNPFANFVSGQLNPGLIPRSSIPTGRPTMTSDDPLALYRKTMATNLAPNIFDGVTVFRGIVLYVFPIPKEMWSLSRLLPSFLNLPMLPGHDKVNFFSCMIPELHAHLPNPYTSVSKSAEDFIKKLELFPIFEPTGTDSVEYSKLESTNAGSIVEIQFSDPNRTHGYVSRAINILDSGIVPTIEISASGAFGSGDAAARLAAGQAVGEGPCPDPDSPGALLMQDLAERLGIDPSVLLAISRVESAGVGPDALRFEPHVFLREQPGASIPYTRGDTNCPDNWRKAGGCVDFVSYQPEETGQAAFERAYAIDPGAALRSTSFGSFQVIPFKDLSHLSENPEEFLTKFKEDPLGLSYELLEARLTSPGNKVDLLAAAKSGDWTAFAVGYNGPAQAQHGYDAKLHATYNSILDQECFDPPVSVV